MELGILSANSYRKSSDRYRQVRILDFDLVRRIFSVNAERE